MKFSRYARHSSFVLGFHGCSREIGEAVLAGETDLRSSENSYDWRGNGIYFWENNLERARLWAEERASQKEPFTLGAVIDLGFVLSLLQTDHIQYVKESYEELEGLYEKEGVLLPENRGGSDVVVRELDCAVIQTLHGMRMVKEKKPFDTVRGLFPEGKELYENAGFRDSNHIQICVRTRSCIKGYFRPIQD